MILGLARFNDSSYRNTRILAVHVLSCCCFVQCTCRTTLHKLKQHQGRRRKLILLIFTSNTPTHIHKNQESNFETLPGQIILFSSPKKALAPRNKNTLSREDPVHSWERERERDLQWFWNWCPCKEEERDARSFPCRWPSHRTYRLAIRSCDPTPWFSGFPSYPPTHSPRIP